MKCNLKEKKGVYQNSTKTCVFDPKKMAAHSYSWWQFVRKERGDVYFNNYRYSVSTHAHQRAVFDKLIEQGVRPIVVSVPDGLQGLEPKELKKHAALHIRLGY